MKNCEFDQTENTETTVSCTSSDLTVSGCYFQGIRVGQVQECLTSQAVGITMKSVARVENNYIYKTGTGVAVTNSDLMCSR